jgi:hypothetical protein
VTTHTVGDITITCSGNAKAYESTTSGEPLAMEAGNNDAITFTSNGKPFASIKIQVDTNSDPGVAGWTWVGSEWTIEWSGTPSTSVTLSGCDIKVDIITFTFGTAEAPITVEPGSSANTWTFSMPGSDVVLTPQYAPTAKWDVVEDVPQQPAALEGIIAGQDAAIVTPGQSAQGTVMYAVTTTAEAAPALTAFSATVPTAKDYDDATTLYVWYYIQGHDTPDGQQATEENTFNDSEISATPLKVDILTNKFDLTLSPAPVKNMTVTVAGQAKTPTDEGKVEAVKMQSEVKLKAATGYKFRKVEVKKGAAAGPPEYYDKLTVTVHTQGYWSCTTGPQATFIGQTITEEQAIALAKYQASKTGNNTVVFYKKESWQMYYAKSDGTTSYGDVATSMSLDGYDVYYVAQ